MTQKLYVERLDAHVHLGKQPAKPLRDAVKYSELRAALVKAGVTLPTPPVMFGYGGAFAQGAWLMLGNGPCDDGSIPEDWAAYGGAGDCAWAGPGHEEMEAAQTAGRPVPKFTCRNILEQYSEYSGYDLETGANDNGSNVADVIAWRQQTGLLDVDGNAYKIGRAVELTPGDLDQLVEAAYLFENAGIGIEVTQANMDQFNAQQPWDYVAGSPVEGGHYIPSMGRWALDRVGFITWAENTHFTPSFYEHQNDEAVCYVDNERYNAVTGDDAEGHDDQDLEKYLTLIAQAR